MQNFKLSLISITITTLIITTVPNAALSQSGRGRPRVSPRETAAPPPPPVKVPEAAAFVKQEQAGPISRFVLRNGMTVIISEQHAVPIAAVVACFKVGTADEPAWANGIAQSLERAVNDTAQAGAPSIDARKIGAIIDSITTVESTSYQVVAPSEKIKEAISIQANAVQNPSLEANAVGRASIYKTDASLYSMSRLLGVAFTAHPISRASQPTGSVTRENLSEFYNIHYRPDNLIIAVVGDVTTFDTLVKIQQSYGGFRAAQPNQPAAGAQPKAAQKTGPPPAPKTIPATQTGDARQTVPPQSITATKPATEPEQTSLRYGADRGDASQSIVSVGFHVPGLMSKDRPAIEVLAAMLGRGRGSQLRRSLLDGQAVVNRVESDYLALRDFGLLTVQMQFVPDSQGGAAIDKAEAAFFKEIDRLRREVPAEAEMARAKSLAEKRFVDRNETYPGRARELATAEAATGGISSAIGYRDLIRAVRAEDVQRVAGRYLTLANTSLHEYESASAAPRTFDSEAFSKTVLAWAPGLTQPVEQKDARAAENNAQIVVVRQGAEQSREDRYAFESVQPLAVRDFSTLSGPRAFVREDHSQPKVAVAILFQGGRAIEDESGITELMLRSMLRGTARRSPAQVANELDQLGATVRPVIEQDFFGFMLDVFSNNADRAIRILRDVTEEPAFRDEDIKRAQVEQIGLIRGSRDDSVQRSKELMLQSLFPAHPYSFPPHGREEVVAKLNGEQLQAWHQITISGQIPVAIIVGDTNGSALVSGSLAEGFRRRDVEGKIKVKTPQQAGPGEKVESRQRPMTAVTIGLPGPKPGSTELPAIELIESALKGNQKIAGDFRMDAEVGLVGGAIYTFLATAPEDEARARAAVLQEFERLARAGLTADEVEQAQALARASNLVSLQSHAERALAYARAIFHQQQPAEVDQFADRLSKLTAEEIKRAAASYFKPTAVAVGVVRGVRQPAPQASPKQD